MDPMIFAVRDVFPHRRFLLQTSVENFLTCFEEKLPPSIESSGSDSNRLPCQFNDSADVVLFSHTVPQSNQSVPSLDCFHRLCELPQIPENLTYKSIREVDGTHILKAATQNALIVVVVSARIQTFFPLPPSSPGPLSRKSLFILADKRHNPR